MKFGLLKRDFEYINKAINNFSDIKKVIIFGSRAMGNFKKGSDVDLALIGENINRETVVRLSGLLNEEFPIPYYFDIVDYTHLTDENLKEHIDTKGKVL
jgi:predicted nucleotidyltransferase